MRLIFVTDLHGSDWKYGSILKIAKDHRVKMVINGGDLLPNFGDLFREQQQFISKFLDNHFRCYQEAGIHYLFYPGNDDLKIYDRCLEGICEKYPFVNFLAQRKVVIDETEFIGLNWVVDYPFRLKDRCRKDNDDYVFQKQLGKGLLSTENGWQQLPDWFSYVNTLPTIEEELAKLVKPGNPDRAVYIIHMPPYRLGLDRCFDGTEVGSKAVYDFIERTQPKLSLHGHIHESPELTGKWMAKLGRTICVQPGQLNKLTYVLIDLDTMEIERY